MSISCIIVDDEPLAREGLKLLIDEVSFFDLKGEFSGALKANDYLQENKVDLIFLDIQMPGLTGLDFAKNIRAASFIVFTTAYPQYALEGFELDALDYLVKPIRPNRFLQMANKVKDILARVNEEPVLETSISNEFVYIKSGRTFHRVFFKDIQYIQGMKDYVMLFTAEEKIMTPMNVKTIYDQLPKSIFARVSKSHIININYIDQVEQESILLSKQSLPLGKSYKENFMENYVRKNLIQRKK